MKQSRLKMSIKRDTNEIYFECIDGIVQIEFNVDKAEAVLIIVEKDKPITLQFRKE